MEQIKILKNRSDLGAGTRGADMGVDAIEIAAINANNDFFNRYDEEELDTENDAIYDKTHNPFAKRISKVLTICTRQCAAVKRIIESNQFPLVISGDHSNALGSISGIKSAFPDKRLGVVWIDAHADLHSPYTSPSGNIHGMPLAAALASDNMDRRVNQVIPETESTWKKLKSINDIEPKIKPEDIVFFGLRDTEEPEDYYIEQNNVRVYRVDEVRFRGMDKCLPEALEKLSSCDMIYISFDVDSMDCDLISKGTGTPVSKGFDQYEVIDIINGLVQSQKVICLEVVEVNPTLDNKGNKMAETAFEVLAAVTPEIEKNSLS